MRTTIFGLLTGLAGLAGVADHGAAAARPQLPPPVARPAIAAIADAFASHDLVALPTAHTRREHEFLRSLVAAPGFVRIVDDFLVEFGNARYQNVVDRYVRGEDVTLAQIQPSWQNAVAPNNIWADEGFFEAVRSANRMRPKDRPMRILLGDSPIDWSTVKTREDHSPWLAMRDSFPAALLQTEVLARRRKSLIVYGSMHLQRQQVMTNYQPIDWRTETIVSLIEGSTPQRVFTIWGIDDDQGALVPNMAAWAVPSLAVTSGTSLGVGDFGAFVPHRPRMTRKGDGLVPLPREDWKVLPVEAQIDAVLYLGPKATMVEAEVPRRACAEPEFLEERVRRIAIAGIPSFEADRLRRICGALPQP